MRCLFQKSSKMIQRVLLLFVVTISFCISCTDARKSLWVQFLDENSRHSYTIFPNTMFKGSYVSIELVCSSNYSNAQIEVRWILKELKCMDQLYNTAQINDNGGILSTMTKKMLQSSNRLRSAPDRIVRDVTEDDEHPVYEDTQKSSDEGARQSSNFNEDSEQLSNGDQEQSSNANPEQLSNANPDQSSNKDPDQVLNAAPEESSNSFPEQSSNGENLEQSSSYGEAEESSNRDPVQSSNVHSLESSSEESMQPSNGNPRLPVEGYQGQPMMEGDGITSMYDPAKHPNVTVMKFMISETQVFVCGKKNIISLQDESAEPYYIGYYRGDLPKGDSHHFMWKRIPSDWQNLKQDEDYRVAEVWETGVYHLVLRVEPAKEIFKFNASVVVKMKSKSGYLPAIEWPQMPTRGILSLLYLLLGTGWIILWARSHQHTLKIHMMIGAIAVAGALDSTMSFVDFTNKHSTGESLRGVSWLTMFLMVLQNGLLQLLVMVVSTGFGITRPKLDKNILGGAISLAALTSVVHFMSNIVLDEDIQIKYNHPTMALTINSLYMLTSLVVAGWIMVFSIMTFIHLCRRKHSSKKVISFTIFTAACVLTFFVNLGLGLFSLGFTKTCTKDWKTEWLLESYGSMSSLILILVLMWLWRPVDQAQSYAFSPLNTDDTSLVSGEYEDDDEEEIILDKVPLDSMSY